MNTNIEPNEFSGYDAAWSHNWDDCMVYGPSRRHQQRIVLKCLKGIKFSSVLDAGCGNGMNLANVVRYFKPSKFAGIDISLEALKKVKAILPQGEYYQLDIQKASLDSSLDLVICCDVLEHLKDDIGSLKNIYKMSNKYVLVSTLAGKMKKSEVEVGHLRNYTKVELIRKLKEAGLVPLKVVEWGFPFFSPLHRFVLDKFPQDVNYGKFGIGRRLISWLLYILFFLNLGFYGDYLFILSSKGDAK
jgi:SAM-dependent methyltransferase